MDCDVIWFDAIVMCDMYEMVRAEGGICITIRDWKAAVQRICDIDRKIYAITQNVYFPQEIFAAINNFEQKFSN